MTLEKIDESKACSETLKFTISTDLKRHFMSIFPTIFDFELFREL